MQICRSATSFATDVIVSGLTYKRAMTSSYGLPMTINHCIIEARVLKLVAGTITETFYKLPLDKQNEIMTAYFDKEKGIGYSLGRTHINSCDFSSESYAYTEIHGVTCLTRFNIKHDLKFRVPFYQKGDRENRRRF